MPPLRPLALLYSKYQDTYRNYTTATQILSACFQTRRRTL